MTAREIVAVYFRADWCAACRLAAPVVERVARSHPDLRLEKIDMAEDDGLAAEMNVRSLPTLILLDEGAREIGRLTGTLSGRRIEAALAAARTLRGRGHGPQFR